jgi:hypothetical protein
VLLGDVEPALQQDLIGGSGHGEIFLPVLVTYLVVGRVRFAEVLSKAAETGRP